MLYPASWLYLLSLFSRIFEVKCWKLEFYIHNRTLYEQDTNELLEVKGCEKKTKHDVKLVLTVITRAV